MKEKELERVLKALANRRRLFILTALKKHGRMTVGDIARTIKLSFKATSKHLAILASAGIVDKVQESLTMNYFIIASLPAGARHIISLL